jgi:integrase
MRASDVKPIMLKSWLAELKRGQSLKAAGVNNYIRTLHGLFQIAVETGAVVESPAKQLKLSKEETPDRLTPTWEQAHNIISATKRQISRDMLSAMLLLGLGQAELENLQGEHFDFERGQISVRRQKTQKVFIIPMYPQARDLLERFKAEGRIVVGQPIFNRVRPREALSLACKHLGYPQYSARSFRRAFIIRALEKGIDPRCVASWQGHRDATLVLRVYGHVIQANHNRQMAERLA